MASSINLPRFKVPLLHKSHFRRPINLFKVSHKPFLNSHNSKTRINHFCQIHSQKSWDAEVYAMVKKVSNKNRKKTISQESSTFISSDQEKSAISTIESIPEDGFEKELLGLASGFPGGEKGLKQFIEKNPPPKNLRLGTWSQLGSIRA